MSTSSRRVALVTGSSRGLGSAIAHRLADDGFLVAVNGLHDDAHADQVVQAIDGAAGSAEAFYADITDERHVAQLVTAVTSAWELSMCWRSTRPARSQKARSLR